MFSEILSDSLNIHDQMKHLIDLIKSKMSYIKSIYKMTWDKLAAIWDYLDNALEKKWIHSLTSFAEASVLFVRFFLFFLFFYFFIKCIQSMTITLFRCYMYAKLHVIWLKLLLYIFLLIYHIDSLCIWACELFIWSSDHINNSKLWKLITLIWAFNLSVWSSSQAS